MPRVRGARASGRDPAAGRRRRARRPARGRCARTAWPTCRRTGSTTAVRMATVLAGGRAGVGGASWRRRAAAARAELAAAAGCGGAARGRGGPSWRPRSAHMLRLDEDLGAFYAVAAERARAGLGAGRGRGAAAAQPDRVRGRGQDDLHDQLRVVGHRADGQRARRLARPAGRGRSRAPCVPGARRRWPRRRQEFFAGGRASRLPRRRTCGGWRPRSPAASSTSRRSTIPALDDEKVRERLLAIDGVGPVCRGARDDAARALPAADPRLVDPADLPAAERAPAGHRQGHRPGVRALPGVRRARVLADADRGWVEDHCPR